MLTLRAIAKGRVQGVGFRNHVLLRAKDFPVCGSVRNLPDGDVEIIAQGNEKDLEAFFASVQIPSHPWIKVKTLNVEPIQTTVIYKDFSVNR